MHEAVSVVKQKAVFDIGQCMEFRRVLFRSAASLGLTAPLTGGTKFGLGMGINDGDELTPGQRGWGGLGGIGRASGRERGEISVVAVSLKKKKENVKERNTDTTENRVRTHVG